MTMDSDHGEESYRGAARNRACSGDCVCPEGADTALGYLTEEMTGDIGDERHCKDMIGRTGEAFGRLDILVNNAAFQVHDRRVRPQF